LNRGSSLAAAVKPPTRSGGNQVSIVKQEAPLLSAPASPFQAVAPIVMSPLRSSLPDVPTPAPMPRATVPIQVPVPADATLHAAMPDSASAQAAVTEPVGKPLPPAVSVKLPPASVKPLKPVVTLKKAVPATTRQPAAPPAAAPLAAPPAAPSVAVSSPMQHVAGDVPQAPPAAHTPAMPSMSVLQAFELLQQRRDELRRQLDWVDMQQRYLLSGSLPAAHVAALVPALMLMGPTPLPSAGHGSTLSPAPHHPPAPVVMNRLSLRQSDDLPPFAQQAAATAAPVEAQFEDSNAVLLPMLGADAQAALHSLPTVVEQSALPFWYASPVPAHVGEVAGTRWQHTLVGQLPVALTDDQAPVEPPSLMGVSATSADDLCEDPDAASKTRLQPSSARLPWSLPDGEGQPALSLT
jgi:hypothetical protein